MRCVDPAVVAYEFALGSKLECDHPRKNYTNQLEMVQDTRSLRRSEPAGRIEVASDLVADHALQRVAFLEVGRLDELCHQGQLSYYAFVDKPHEQGQKPALATKLE